MSIVRNFYKKNLNLKMFKLSKISWGNFENKIFRPPKNKLEFSTLNNLSYKLN